MTYPVTKEGLKAFLIIKFLVFTALVVVGNYFMYGFLVNAEWGANIASICYYLMAFLGFGYNLIYLWIEIPFVTILYPLSNGPAVGVQIDVSVFYWAFVDLFFGIWLVLVNNTSIGTVANGNIHWGHFLLVIYIWFEEFFVLLFLSLPLTNKLIIRRAIEPTPQTKQQNYGQLNTSDDSISLQVEGGNSNGQRTDGLSNVPGYSSKTAFSGGLSTVTTRNNGGSSFKIDY